METNFHRQVMNIPCDDQQNSIPVDDALSAYRHGHRDARHAAAELVNAADEEIAAWRERFPQYKFRPQDGCVALKFDANAYGCHCELSPDQIPDQCVLGTDKEDDCVHAIILARNNKVKTECQYWLPIQPTA